MRIIYCFLALGLCQLSLSSPVAKFRLPFQDIDDNGVLIIGGEEATPHEFPFLVHVDADNIFCGGSLIAMDLVLTGAACLHRSGVPIPTNKIKVTAGDHNLKLTEDTEETLTAILVKIHENYSTVTNLNDIALIKLSRAFSANFAVRPIALPTISSALATTGTVAGWGRDQEGEAGQMADFVQKVDVPIVKNCEMSYPTGRFCAGENGKGSCRGDGGGPFICNDAGNPHVCGVHSRIVGGCGGSHGIYTNVSVFIPWIEEHGTTPLPTTKPTSTSTPSPTNIPISTSTPSPSNPTTLSTSTPSTSSPITSFTSTTKSPSTTSKTTTTSEATEDTPSTTLCVPYDPTTQSSSDSTTDESTTDSSTDSSSPVTICMPPATEPSSSTMLIGPKILALFVIVIIISY